MKNLTLQQLVAETREALERAGTSNYYKRVFKTLQSSYCFTQKTKMLIHLAWILPSVPGRSLFDVTQNQREKRLCSLPALHKCNVRVSAFRKCESLSGKAALTMRQ